MIEKIYNKNLYNDLQLDKQYLYLLIHSGSRNKGEMIYREFASKDGIVANSCRFNDYMKKHDDVIVYARKNRMNLADIFIDMLGKKVKNRLVIDVIHNYIEVIDDCFYHHKGSISSYKNQYAIIAGSRGSYSYIVRCLSDESLLYSISHGAGRKIVRSKSKALMRSKYKRKELLSTAIGYKVVVYKDDALYEEACENYKDIESVIDVLIENHCIELVCRLKPLVNYKC